MSETDAEVLAEQAAYYRTRAAEYDEWFQREGRYDRGAAANALWFAERDEVFTAFDALAPTGDVLELAPGTGIWTERLVPAAASITAVDASAEMIALNRARLGQGAAKVTYVLADLFRWEPPHPFDAVVFCFWISHVPDSRLATFLAMVARALRPGGRLLFLDGQREPTSTASDHILPGNDDQVMVRQLNDGRAFRIVKRFRAAGDLEARCRAVGLDVTVRETATYFQYCVGTRDPVRGP
ncbi:MAG: class I SAM-dependent methyltransferase [Acidimicrobiales bacterium]